jgi:hypothetical protein
MRYLKYVVGYFYSTLKEDLSGLREIHSLCNQKPDNGIYEL